MNDSEDNSNKTDRRKAAETVINALEHSCGPSLRGKVINSLAGMVDEELFCYHISREFISDMFIGLTGNIVRRLSPHVSRDTLISEVDAAIHDWVILVNLYYKPKLLIEGGDNPQILQAAEAVGRFGAGILRETCDMLDNTGGQA